MTSVDRMYLEGLLELCKRASNESFCGGDFENGMNTAYKIIAEGIAKHIANDCECNKG